MAVMNSKKYNFFVYQFPVIVWAIIILTVSSIPHFACVKPSWTKFDKVAHFIEYGILCYLLTRALGYRSNRTVTKFIIILSIAICGVLAGIDELHQKYIPGRFTSIGDFIADISGIVFAQVIYYKNFFKKSKVNN